MRYNNSAQQWEAISGIDAPNEMWFKYKKSSFQWRVVRPLELGIYWNLLGTIIYLKGQELQTFLHHDNLQVSCLGS